MSQTADVEQFQHCNDPNISKSQKSKCNHISDMLIHIPSEKSQKSVFQLLTSKTDAPKLLHFPLQHDDKSNYFR